MESHQAFLWIIENMKFLIIGTLSFAGLVIFALGIAIGFGFGYVKAINRAIEGNHWIAKMMEAQRLNMMERKNGKESKL